MNCGLSSSQKPKKIVSHPYSSCPRHPRKQNRPSRSINWCSEYLRWFIISLSFVPVVSLFLASLLLRISSNLIFSLSLFNISSLFNLSSSYGVCDTLVRDGKIWEKHGWIPHSLHRDIIYPRANCCAYASLSWALCVCFNKKLLAPREGNIPNNDTFPVFVYCSFFYLSDFLA